VDVSFNGTPVALFSGKDYVISLSFLSYLTITLNCFEILAFADLSVAVNVTVSFFAAVSVVSLTE